MVGNGVEMCLIICQILGPYVFGWSPYHFVLGAQLASGEKKVCLLTVCIFSKI